jgi:hypothetical protein
MMRVRLKMGAGPYGPSFMKFTLTYQGELRPNDDSRRKWQIRKYFHPQLEELWRVHPSLQSVEERRQIPIGGYWFIERHHTVSANHLKSRIRGPGYVEVEDSPNIDVLAPIVVAR